MEKSLSDYDKSLEALDKEKERLENVMRLMGEEWAERYGDQELNACFFFLKTVLIHFSTNIHLHSQILAVLASDGWALSIKIKKPSRQQQDWR